MQNNWITKVIKFAFFLSLFLGIYAHAQINNASKMDPSKIDVAKLDNAQLTKIMSEMQARGLSEQDAISLAQSRGMSPDQISLLRSRLLELRGNSSSAETSDLIDQEILPDQLVISEKKKVEASPEEKRIFGFNLFNSDKLSFEPNLNLPASKTYIVGVGDEILISVWGNSQQTYRLNVDRSGMVTIPNVGSIRVGSYKFEEVENIITNRLSQIYSDLKSSEPKTFATITLGSLRAITVSVVGEVFFPGTYVLPSTATAFNALYQSGGPNILGSFRDIRVIREGKVIKSLDVFDFLINGNSEVNCSLMNGDIILVPTFEYRVRVGGELKRNGIFEGKKGETISDIIRFAGGFSENAYSSKVELYRKNAKERSILDVDSALLSSVKIQNGDSLHIGKILSRYSNLITINGAVFHPGNYQYTDSLSLKEVFGSADGLKEDAFLNRGLISRQNYDLSRSSIYFNPQSILDGSENIILQKNDVITIYSIFDLQEVQIVELFGYVLHPGTFAYEKDLTLSSVILKGKGFKESGSEILIEVSRRISKEDMAKISQPIVRLFQFKVGRDLKITEGDSNFKIEPFDQIFVRKAPSYQERAIIKVVGEVMYSGDYSISSKTERLSEIIKRAGGLTSGAYLDGVMLTRQVELSLHDKMLREEMLKRDPLLKFSELNFEVVGIDFASVMKNPGGIDDIFVKGGDELLVPTQKQTVKISGEVTNSLSITFKERTSVKSYIRKAGGFSNMSKRSRTYVIYPNGESDVTRKRLLFFNNYPNVTAGSEIVVPPHAKREPITPAMWISIASAMSALALTIITISTALKK